MCTPLVVTIAELKRPPLPTWLMGGSGAINPSPHTCTEKHLRASRKLHNWTPYYSSFCKEVLCVYIPERFHSLVLQQPPCLYGDTCKAILRTKKRKPTYLPLTGKSIRDDWVPPLQCLCVSESPLVFDVIMAAHQPPAAVPSPVMNSTAPRRPTAPKQDYGLDVWQPREKVGRPPKNNTPSKSPAIIPSSSQYCTVVKSHM